MWGQKTTEVPPLSPWISWCPLALCSAVEKWQALSTLLEAFGNSPTIMNGSATRFSQILSLDFDQAGQVASASIQVRGIAQA